MGTTYIFANPGQVVRLAVQTVDGYGNRADGYVPVVQSVLFPDLSPASSYPLNMTRIDTGFFVHGVQIPSGSTSVGTYLISIYYQTDYTYPDGYQDGTHPVWETFAIQVAKPFGNTSVSPI
jgi:hypothetical protein